MGVYQEIDALDFVLQQKVANESHVELSYNEESADINSFCLRMYFVSEWVWECVCVYVFVACTIPVLFYLVGWVIFSRSCHIYYVYTRADKWEGQEVWTLSFSHGRKFF